MFEDIKKEEDRLAYIQAIESIKENSFNLSNVPVHLIDIRLMRFVRKRNIWAADAYCPKKLKANWSEIVLDNIHKKEMILADGSKIDFEDIEA